MEFGKAVDNAMKKYREAFKSLAAIEKKERILEQWNKPDQCCITCKYYDWAGACSRHVFPITEKERANHTCKDHVYDTMGVYDD
jgi:hypothetical protein